MLLRLRSACLRLRMAPPKPYRSCGLHHSSPVVTAAFSGWSRSNADAHESHGERWVADVSR
jgi:hypothetical protein